MKKLVLLALTCLSCVHAFSSSKKIDEVTWEPLRVNELLPDLYTVPALDFAIPKHYTSISSKDINKLKDFEKYKYFNTYFWGPKDVIEDAFENLNSKSLSELDPKEPIFEVELSPLVAQVGPNTFSGEDQMDDMPAGITTKKMMWGEYPVWVVNYKPEEGDEFNLIYVGLNYASQVVQISVFLPKDSKEKNIEFWETFLSQTKPLDLLDCCKSTGEDIKEGLTVVKLEDSFLKVIAERRKSDGKVQIAVVPCAKEISFDSKGILSIHSSKTALKSHFNNTLIKINGELKLQNSANNSLTTFRSINAVIKDVDDFSINKKARSKIKNIKFYSSEDIQEV